MKKFWTVVRVLNGTLEAKRPAVVASLNPWPHDEFGKASEEAERLAKTHKATFVVMEAILESIPVVSSKSNEIL
jgi:hypothetical protein